MGKLPPRSNHSIKVFIADDSFVVRERLVVMLDELAGIEIMGQAEHGAEAINAIRMPGGSGIDVLRNIKQDGVGPIVIMLTNYPFLGYWQRCLRAGADFFLDKSTEFDQIPALVERLKQGSGFDQAQPG